MKTALRNRIVLLAVAMAMLAAAAARGQERSSLALWGERRVPVSKAESPFDASVRAQVGPYLCRPSLKLEACLA